MISVIATCFNEQESLVEMYERVVQVFRELPKYDFELIFVDNASVDNSRAIYRKLAKTDRRVKVVIMSRNFGSPQPSFIAGMEYSRGEAVVLLHGDIQDPPELILKFIREWEKGFAIVYGVRTKREGYGPMWNFFYKAFYWLLNKLAYIKIPLNAGEFSLMDRRVVKELLNIDEYDYYVRCLRAYVGFSQIGVPYVRDARHHGVTTENIWTSIWWAKTILVNFSFKPLEWISFLGLTVTGLSFVFLLINLFVILFFRDAPRGVPTIVILILFLGGVQLLSLSVIAEYLAKVFLEVKRRPKYIVGETLNIRK